MSECQPGVPSGPRKRSLSPSLNLALPRASSGSGTEFNAGPSIPARVLRGRLRDLNLHGPAPQARRPGLESGTWQDSPLRRNNSSSLDDPSPRYYVSWGHWLKEGTWGRGGRPNTNTRTTPTAGLRAKAISANALVAAQTPLVSPGVWGTAFS